MTIQRPFLKWAGAKTKLVPAIRHHLPATVGQWVEPFMGSCAAALNIRASEYILADSNADLSLLYGQVVHQTDQLVTAVKAHYLVGGNNDAYYRLRAAFNTKDLVPLERAAHFIYLNRFCFNGLCRYNSKGLFNTPYGRHSAPFLPEAEIHAFVARLGAATFLHQDFLRSFDRAEKGAVIYCDPPYVPIGESAFTSYAGGEFTAQAQESLAAAAEEAQGRGIHVLISNHDTPFTRRLYQKATHIQEMNVTRTIGRYKGQARTKAKELLATYAP